jgi:hypothetical protein
VPLTRVALASFFSAFSLPDPGFGVTIFFMQSEFIRSGRHVGGQISSKAAAH